MAPDTPALEVRRLVAGYGGADILHGVDLHVGAEEVVAVLGPNGAGKSTVLKAVFGLIHIRDGKVLAAGRDVTGLGPRDMAAAGVGYVPQSRNVFANLSVEENLEMGALPQSDPDKVAAARQRVDHLFPALAENRRRRAAQLSGGQRQMVAMARALMAAPHFLLLDEPSAGLAPNLAASVFEAVRRVAASGVPILLVEQNAREALRMSDRAYILDQGQNRFEGSSADLAKDEDVAKLYLGG